MMSIECIHAFNEITNTKSYFFLRVEHLLLEAEALYLVEILASLEGNYVVSGDSNNRLVSRILSSVKGECSLTGGQLEHENWT